MPHLFFDVLDGNGEVYRDDEGLDLPSTEAAREYAFREAQGVIAEDPAGTRDYSQWEIRVRDAAGTLLLTVSIPDACRGNGSAP